jgi:cell division transport system permease protein
MLPFLVAAMAFLAALALAGWTGAAGLSRHWQEGAGSALTVQVPNPKAPAAAHQDGARLAAVLALLDGTPGIASARTLPEEEINDLLRPWLGAGAERVSVPLPAVVAVQLNGMVDPIALGQRVAAVAPGSMVEDHGVWIGRLSALARSLQACAGLALALVVAVAATVIAVATRAGLVARREAIEIVHGLGATDGFIAGRFAARATLLAALGGLGGAMLATPVLLTLARLAEPFTGTTREIETVTAALEALPIELWLALPGLPVAAAIIGFLTAQGTVRRWLRQLP